MSKKIQKSQIAAVQTTRVEATDILARIRAKHATNKANSTARLEKTLEAGPKKTAPKSKPAPKAAPAVESKPKAQPVPKQPKEMPLCTCGCGGRTKGGKYLPGHDSKHRSALAGPKEMPLCGCGCGDRTKGGRFLPGHDAKFHSAQKKAAAMEQAQAQTKAA